MSFYNKQLDYMNLNSNYEAQTQNSAQSSSFSNMRELPNQVDVRYSTLEPTAQEFHPSSQTPGSTNGAVKKTTRNEKNQYRSKEKNRRNWYGSGRTFNGSKRDYYNRNERSYKNEEQNSFQNNASFVDKLNHDSCIDDDDSYNSDKFAKEKKNLDNSQPKSTERNVEASSKQYGSRNKYKENARGDYQTSNVDSSQSYENSNKNFRGNNRTYEKSYRTNIHNKYERSNNYYEKSEGSSTFDRYNRSDNYDNSGKNYTNNYTYRKNSNNSFERSNIDQFEIDNYKTQKNDFYNGEFKTGFKPFNNKNDKYTDGKTRKDWRTTTNSYKHSKDSTTKLNKKCKYLKHSFWYFLTKFSLKIEALRLILQIS